MGNVFFFGRDRNSVAQKIWNKMKKGFITILVQVLIFLVLGEILSRLVITLPEQVQHLHFNTTEIDAELGWKTKANYQFQNTVADGGGVDYEIDYRTYENGFRNVNATEADTIEQKIWFIGDSYTQAVEVSNEKTFYGVLEKEFPLNAFAYGASGYSTYQQFLVFEKYVDEIQPDVVVWQFCSNDFIDNYHELEKAADYKIGVRRPYLNLQGERVYHTPIPKLLEWGKKSRLAYAFFLIQEKVKSKFGEKRRSAETQIAEDHLDYPTYKTAYDITDLILKKIKNKLPAKTKILFFSADAYNPQMQDFADLCIANGLPVELGTAHELNAANFGRKEMMFAYDNYHWNNRGHEVVAAALKKRLLSGSGGF